MKRFFAAFFCTIAIACSLVSCNGMSSSVPEPVVFESFSIDSVCPLFYNYDNPACHISIMMEKPSASNSPSLVAALESSLSALPREGSLAEYAGGSLEGMAKAYVRQFFFQYLLDGKEAIDSYNGDEEAAATWMNYEERVTGSVLYNSDGFVCYQYNIYSYAGGAHGNTQIRNCVFDCKLKRSLALCDIFSAESYPLVSQKIRQQLMKQYDCASLDELSGKSFFDPEKISVTENFLIDEDGMSWLFDPYEIAAYAMGEISVRLSWHDLKPLILEESPLYDLADQYDV